MEFERPSPKLLFITVVFFATVLAFSFVLRQALSAFTLSREGFLTALPSLFFFFMVASLTIIFALLAEKQALVLGTLIAAVLFVLPLTSLPTLGRLMVALISFAGFLLLCSQVRGIHEAYVGFSASYYKGVMRNFFLLLTLILGLVLFVSTAQVVKRQKLEIPEETIKPVVGQFVEAVGKVLQRQSGGIIPEAQLASLVEEQLVQLLRQVGLELRLKGQPKSFTQATSRITEALSAELGEIITPFRVYIPFLVGGVVVLTLFAFTPFVGLVGVPVFFAVYRFLILIKLLKFEEVERTVKRLTLA